MAANGGNHLGAISNCSLRSWQETVRSRLQVKGNTVCDVITVLSLVTLNTLGGVKMLKTHDALRFQSYILLNESVASVY